LVLDEDSGLGEQLDAAVFGAAKRESSAYVLCLDEWPSGGVEAKAPPGSLGLLVLGGFLGRRVTVQRKTWTELLSVGDVLRPWHADRERIASVPAHADWRVLAPVRLAVLDRSFVHRMAPWPEVLSTLAGRIVDRTRTLSYALAVGGRIGVAERVELTLRDCADRWGHVAADGIVVQLPGLTHELLANVVGAARPSVTTALTELAGRGVVRRLDDERWLITY
jgi:CRP/FNR family transcriptional regulator, cyclic AMP receptor protein